MSTFEEAGTYLEFHEDAEVRQAFGIVMDGYIEVLQAIAHLNMVRDRWLIEEREAAR